MTRQIKSVFRLGCYMVDPADAAGLCAYVVASGYSPLSWVSTPTPGLTVVASWQHVGPDGQGTVSTAEGWQFGWPLALFRPDMNGAGATSDGPAAPPPRVLLVRRDMRVTTDPVDVVPENRDGQWLAALDSLALSSVAGPSGAWCAWLGSPGYWPSFLDAELLAARAGHAAPPGAPNAAPRPRPVASPQKR